MTSTEIHGMGAALKERWRTHERGKCVVMSQGLNCQCSLCLIDKLATAAMGVAPGLSVHYAEDGCWLRFKASTGSEVCLNLHHIAGDCGPQTEKTLRQWLEDTKPNQRRLTMPVQAKVIPEVNIMVESVDVTPETADQIACDLVAKHGPAHLKYRGTLNVFMPPYVPNDGIPKVPGVEYQRNKIMCGEVSKLFYTTVTANY